MVFKSLFLTFCLGALQDEKAAKLQLILPSCNFTAPSDFGVTFLQILTSLQGQKKETRSSKWEELGSIEKFCFKNFTKYNTEELDRYKPYDSGIFEVFNVVVVVVGGGGGGSSSSSSSSSSSGGGGGAFSSAHRQEGGVMSLNTQVNDSNLVTKFGAGWTNGHSVKWMTHSINFLVENVTRYAYYKIEYSPSSQILGQLEGEFMLLQNSLIFIYEESCYIRFCITDVGSPYEITPDLQSHCNLRHCSRCERVVLLFNATKFVLLRIKDAYFQISYCNALIFSLTHSSGRLISITSDTSNKYLPILPFIH
ncbi:hypothetical protein EGR_01223 [Echinococcus granulosus]|uniref:Uncharacterized protein n=1 Tax=Echinococcus granulosus TaxID=6210 RepID=W6UQW4_ECHGR|nr:hypothetical protein EGR_01223 [Echinococcus granulosus]EUB64095.1 hypothetical protein EGR_01223 [Echinococcus granulosus]